MELDWKLIWSVVQVILSLVAATLVFIMGKVFIKKEPFVELDKRVQTLEETYVKKDDFDELEKRVGKLESAIEGMPDLVKSINDELIDLRSTARHMDETIKRVERPINLIVEAAMKGNKQ